MWIPIIVLVVSVAALWVSYRAGYSQGRDDEQSRCCKILWDQAGKPLR